MELEALIPETLADAAKRLGGGPVVMINFLRFRDRPLYSDGFEHVKTTSRSAYYEGYASAFPADRDGAQYFNGAYLRWLPIDDIASKRERGMGRHRHRPLRQLRGPVLNNRHTGIRVAS